MAKSLIDSLLAGVQDITKGGVGGVASQAKGAWDSQSTLTKGAIAGGLLGVLLSGNARKLVGTGVQVGGAALVGALAFRAYNDWKAGKSAGAEDAPAALPAPSPDFLPASAEAQEDLALRLVQAMVAATKADGHVTTTERARIMGQLPNLGLGDEAQALIAAEIDAPFDVNRIAALAHTPEEAAEIYAASLLVVDPEAPAEKGYLAMLAARLNLEQGLVEHLHAKAGALA